MRPAHFSSPSPGHPRMGSNRLPPKPSSYPLMAKEFSDDSEPLSSAELEEMTFFDALKSTRNDVADMMRLGREQELARHFRAASMFSFTAILQATWEFVLVSMYQGLFDGGRAGMVWSCLWTTVGFLPIICSLAEMASMAPTSGGQYHWVSEFAPARYQKVLSYFAGWQATMSWQAGNASGPFVMGTLIQSLIAMNFPDYDSPRWQGTLMVIANIALVYAANAYGTEYIPVVQNTLMVLHVFLFFAVVVPLWVLAPHASAGQVFTDFYNGGGWSSMFLAVMVGQISSIWGGLGIDAAAHMAEEAQDAGRTVPAAMVGSYVMNGILGAIVVITVCFAIPNLEGEGGALEGDYAHLYAFSGAMSNGWSTALNALILVVIFASNVSYLASTARETWSFGRDKGLPGWKWILKVNGKRQIPQNALLLSAFISIALSLIYIASDTAFFAIISLNVVALMATYSLSIGCVLWRRVFHPETLPKARWSLGKWGVPVNVAGLMYSAWAFFWAFWPAATPVDLSGFNWSVVMFSSVMIISAILYLIQGRKLYDGPVTLVIGRKQEFELDGTVKRITI